MARSLRASGTRPGDVVHVAYGYGLSVTPLQLTFYQFAFSLVVFAPLAATDGVAWLDNLTTPAILDILQHQPAQQPPLVNLSPPRLTGVTLDDIRNVNMH